MENEYDPKYQQGKIYKIVCNITNEIYIGSTIQTLEKRLGQHKNQNYMSKQIIEQNNYEIELIKDYPCNNKRELEEEESKYIRENKCINIVIPNRTMKEWREDNKEKLKKQMKEYNEKYKEKNKEEINEKALDHYHNNKEEINKKRLEKVKCECGALVARAGLTRHLKSLKHIKLTECIIID